MFTKNDKQLQRIVEIDDKELELIFSPSPIRVITAVQLSKLVGYTPLTVKRLAHHPEKNTSKIPPPVKIRGENLWVIETVEKWLQEKKSILQDGAV